MYLSSVESEYGMWSKVYLTSQVWTLYVFLSHILCPKCKRYQPSDWNKEADGTIYFGSGVVDQSSLFLILIPLDGVSSFHYFALGVYNLDGNHKSATKDIGNIGARFSIYNMNES